MVWIKKLTDEDFGLTSIPLNNPRQRFGARGIVVNPNNEIAILYKELKKEYKLIGGGIDENEAPSEAFKREALEETGYKVEIINYLGKTKEEKSQDNFIQTSHVYLAQIIENTYQQNLTTKELGEGSKLIWCKLDNAMNLIKESESLLIASKFESKFSVYHTKFIVKRDYEILKYYKQNILNETIQ